MRHEAAKVDLWILGLGQQCAAKRPVALLASDVCPQVRHERVPDTVGSRGCGHGRDSNAIYEHLEVIWSKLIL